MVPGTILVCTAILTCLHALTRQYKVTVNKRKHNQVSKLHPGKLQKMDGENRFRTQARHLQQLQAVLLKEISELRCEAARLNTPSTFSKHAKALRTATAKEKQLAALHDRPHDPRQWDWQDQLLLAIKVLQVGRRLLMTLDEIAQDDTGPSQE